MGLIALFETMTGAVVEDCVVDDKNDRIIFVVKKGHMGLAIGKKGRKVKLLEKLMRKKLEVVEYSEDVREFLANALKPVRIQGIRLTERPDGRKIAVVSVDPKDKARAIGKNGRNAEKLRLLARRYFGIDNVMIL
ncbi:transcription elongation factor NusA [Candidatus Bathyarchaeota archaeon ex4484_135]|nr:MAG: transcription elongation factor NusA [Candidatus Bathyarchaeota archaeon ex4484_135]